MGLTDKQRLFISAYRVDPNTKRAAISAGYSDETASQAGSRLLKHPKVAFALSQAAPVAQASPSAADVKAAAFVPNLLAALSDEKSPLTYMLNVMNDPDADEERRDRMAVSAAPYCHTKKGEGGKKDSAKDAARVASTGKFAAGVAPKLVVNNR